LPQRPRLVPSAAGAAVAAGRLAGPLRGRRRGRDRRGRRLDRGAGALGLAHLVRRHDRGLAPAAAHLPVPAALLHPGRADRLGEGMRPGATAGGAGLIGGLDALLHLAVQLVWLNLWWSLLTLRGGIVLGLERKSTRLHSSHVSTPSAVFCSK